MKESREMKEYQRPIAQEIEINLHGIIAASGLQYSDESADNDYEVLAGKHRGEWGNMWKQ